MKITRPLTNMIIYNHYSIIITGMPYMHAYLMTYLKRVRESSQRG